MLRRLGKRRCDGLPALVLGGIAASQRGAEEL